MPLSTPPTPRTKGRVARQQLFKSERVHVYVCVCVCVCASCQASVRLVCGNVKSREVPTNHSSPLQPATGTARGPRGEETERNDVEEEDEELYTWLEGE